MDYFQFSARWQPYTVSHTNLVNNVGELNYQYDNKYDQLYQTISDR